MVVGDARSPDSVEPAFQDGRKTEPPSGKDNDKSFCGEQAADLRLNGTRVKRRAVVTPALVGRKRRRKVGLVEVFDLHFVTGLGQRFDGRARHDVANTVCGWMSHNDKALHGKDGRRATVLMLANLDRKKPRAR